MKLTIGIATRGRREIVEKTVYETRSKCAESGTQIVVLADDDDSMREIPGAILSVEPRTDSVAEKWNRMMRIAPADVYMPVSDYRYQATFGFDTAILKAASLFNDGIGCVYQHMANLSFPCNQAVTSKLAEIMGCIYVQHFPYWFVDHWLDDVCKMIGRIAYAEGETKLQKRPGTGTQDFREPAFWAVVYDALQSEREVMAENILAEMDEQAWRKDMLRAQWPLIHQRSMMLNQTVRAIPETDKTRDARYLRIKDTTVRQLRELYREAA